MECLLGNSTGVGFVTPNIADVADEVKRDRGMLTAGSSVDLQVSQDKQTKSMNNNKQYFGDAFSSFSNASIGNPVFSGG